MWILLISLFCQFPLLTTPEECQALVAQKEKAFLIDPQCLYLAGIIYTSPQSWVIWINDQKWTPHHLPTENYSILGVSRTTVKLRIQGKSVTLRTHQSYSLRTGLVRNGDLRKPQ